MWHLIGFAFFTSVVGNASFYILMDNDLNIQYKQLIEEVENINLH